MNFQMYQCAVHGLQPAHITASGKRYCDVCFVESTSRLQQVQERLLSKSNSSQIGGSHYKDKAIQPWDYIISNGLGYLEGNIVKYVSRYKEKNGLEDLKKARHYLDKLIETQEGK